MFTQGQDGGAKWWGYLFFQSKSRCVLGVWEDTGRDRRIECASYIMPSLQVKDIEATGGHAGGERSEAGMQVVAPTWLCSLRVWHTACCRLWKCNYKVMLLCVVNTPLNIFPFCFHCIYSCSLLHIPLPRPSPAPATPPEVLYTQAYC